MPVKKEQYRLENDTALHWFSLSDVEFHRRPSGTWTLRAKVYINFELPDGRVVWAAKPLTIAGLSQTGRRKRTSTTYTPDDVPMLPIPTRCERHSCTKPFLEEHGEFLVCPACRHSYGSAGNLTHAWRERQRIQRLQEGEGL